MRVKMQKYVSLKGFYFPQKMEIYFKNPFNEYKEEIYFKNIEFLEKIPDSIKNFKFPKGTKIEVRDLRWGK